VHAGWRIGAVREVDALQSMRIKAKQNRHIKNPRLA